MNYYIDFDNTLYETSKLRERMLKVISTNISKEKKIDEQKLYEECESMFNRENIYDIYELANYFEKKYSIKLDTLATLITNRILDSSDLVFKDTVPFLLKLKETGSKIYMLTYCAGSLEFQTIKIAGSKLSNYFDSLIITKEPKDTLDIDYKNGIFIDDNPKDLMSLYAKNPIKVIRIRRAGNKYSIKDLEEKEIIEYKNLKDFADVNFKI